MSRDGVGGDAWVMSFTEAEVKLLEGANRKIVLSVLKAMWETNIDCDVINSMHLSNLLLIECEKHQNEEEWTPEVIGDRIIGTLLQVILISSSMFAVFVAYFESTIQKMCTLHAGQCRYVQGMSSGFHEDY